ncbi:MAG: hypothetical protein DMD62_12340 [Gemmatimonadetes bacterium]|nr:MAG: hypothetical protein DMD62_12340 [Gemmatimonadota bacterium]
MSRLTLVLIPAFTTLTFSTAHAQTCTDPHYRWTVKTTVALQDSAPTPTTPSAMLKWTPPELYHPAVGAHDCTPRAGRELTVYAVTGWARAWHVDKAPGDLDWHIELTQSRTTKPGKCIVAEIPDPQYGAMFATARQRFLDLIINSKTNKKKAIVPPVRLTVIGPAFFDAQHRGAKGSGKPPSKHGNCNSSAGALWEIHPVYQVTHP